MRSGVVVVVICLVVGVVLAFVRILGTQHSTLKLQDLFTALAYYMAEYDGAYPPSEEAFKAAPFWTAAEDGGIRLTHQPEVNLQREPVGKSFTDFAHYEIAWGTSLANLKINSVSGHLNDPDNEEVILVKFGAPEAVMRQFSRNLLEFYQDLTVAPAPNPLTESGGATSPDAPDSAPSTAGDSSAADIDQPAIEDSEPAYEDGSAESTAPASESGA